MRRSFNPVFADRPKSIFPTMSALARAHNAINLGQGFPDEDGPASMLKIAADAIVDGPNQYVPVEGLHELREAVARDNQRFYGLDINPHKETLVVSGATEGLAAAFLGLLVPGDEVVVFAPFYECYAPQIEAAGAVVRVVDLQPPNWRITSDVLGGAINHNTKLIVLNSPHNPLGKVVSTEEQKLIAAACIEHDLIAVCDEVYEHLIFDDVQHVPLMAMPGMFERTLRIGSAGKTFSVTGWRIGYVTGPAQLIEAVMKAHQNLAYTSPPNYQTAVARALGLGDNYYTEFRSMMQSKRDFMAAGLSEAGLKTLPCEGTYFITVDIQSVGRSDDMEFCREITEHAKVAAVPLSAFYHPTSKNPPKNFVRFCFCKKEQLLKQACENLKHYFLISSS